MGSEPIINRILPRGDHTVTLYVDDGQGHNVTDQVSVRVVRPVAPEERLHLNVITPRPSDLLKGEVIISGTAHYELGEVVSVEVSIGGNGWRPAEGTEAWSLAWDTSLVADGIHSIEVRVTADDGTYKVESVLVEVRNTVVPEPPEVPNVTLRLRDHGVVDELLEFSAEGEDLAPWTLVWSFGDGRNGQGTTVRHAYKESGTYEVTLELWLEGQEGPAATFKATVIIESGEPEGLSLEALLVIALVMAGIIYLAGFYGGRKAFHRD